MYETKLTCPVCDEVMDVHTHAQKDPGGFATALVASDCRRIHLKRSPDCQKHSDWVKGWNLSEPVEINMVTKALCDGLADDLAKRGFHIRRFDSEMFYVVDKPWNEEDDDIALRYAIHAQSDGYLIADHTKYSEDAKHTTLVPYDVPDMLEKILCILGE